MTRSSSFRAAGWLAALFIQMPAMAADDPASAPEAQAQVRSVYAGWRLYVAQCARCHGSDAAGGADAPDLRSRLSGMSQERFVGTVLRRYQWTLPAGEAATEGAAREALVEDVLKRRAGAMQMPAWEEEPAVRVHIGDLYAYLDARAAGRIGSGRPPRPGR